MKIQNIPFDNIENRSEKEILIIKASEIIFSRYGYQKTTVKDIAEEVGLKKTSLYHYFKNKEEIFFEVILFQFMKFKNKIEIFNSEKPIKERVFQLYESLLTFNLKNSLAQQALELDFKLITPHTVNKIMKMKEFSKNVLKLIITDGINKNEIRNIEPEEITSMLVYLFEGIRTIELSKKRLTKVEIDLDSTLKNLKSSLDIAFLGLLTKN